MRRLWSVVILGFAVLAVMLGAPLAQAITPEAYSFSGTNSDVVHCGTFDDDFTDVFSGSGAIYFDQAGNPIRVIEHDVSHSTDTNSITGLALHEHDRSTTIIDLITGEVSIVGAPIRMNRKGEGIVIQDTGIVVFDADGNIIFEGGPHQLLHQGDDVFCAALS